MRDYVCLRPDRDRSRCVANCYVQSFTLRFGIKIAAAARCERVYLFGSDISARPSVYFASGSDFLLDSRICVRENICNSTAICVPPEQFIFYSIYFFSFYI